MRSVLIFAVVAAGVFAAAEKGWLRIYFEDDGYPLAYSIAAAVMLIVLQDTWFYWTHRALHHPLLYRRFHQVHHKSRYPTPYTSYAFDSGEAFTNAIYILVAGLIFPYPIWALLYFMIHMLVRNVIGHCGYSIDPARSDGRPVLDFLTTTVHHDLHHTANRGNFGLYFTFWDRLMGTEHPEYRERFIEQNRRDRPVSAPTAHVG
jgi:sterol desaturase/sphingolipid hydroxylase (fatty acid hydroxylase superfamily)